MNQDYSFLFAGTFAGITSKLIEYPFDTLKVILQTRPDAVKTTNLNLYRGVSIPLIFASLENSIMFHSYHTTNKYLHDKLHNQTLRDFFAGFVSGIISSFIMTPSELVKCKLQYNSIENKKISMMNFIKNINKTTGFYHGHLSTMCREGIGTSIYFAMYDQMKRKMKSQEFTQLWQMALAGSISGMCYWTSILPIDTIKSNKQISTLSYQEIIKNINNKYGFFGFYRGYKVTMLKACVSNFFIFYSYEFALQVL